MVPAMANASHSQGASVVLLGGSTGDWPCLSVEERIDRLKAWTSALDAMAIPSASGARSRPMQLLFHVDHTDIHDARALAEAAGTHGADAILSIAPGVVYRPPSGIEGAKQVATQLGYIAAGAPSLPLWYYHFPSLYIVDVDLPAMVSYALTGGPPPQDGISAPGPPLAPTLHGIKYIDTNIDDVQRSLRIASRAQSSAQSRAQSREHTDSAPTLLSAGNFSVYIKNPLAVACLPVGCNGAPVQTLGARELVELGKAWDRGDLEAALDHQFRLLQLADVYAQYGALPLGRAAYKEAYGVNLGPLRVPQYDLAGEQLADGLAALRKIGFLQ